MMTWTMPLFIPFFLITIRMSVVLLLTPIAAIQQLPIHVRLIFIFSLSGLFVSNLHESIHLTGTTPFILSAFSEFCTGLILSMSLYAAFSVFHIAGQLIDTQIGVNSIALFDPSNHAHEPLTARLLTMLALFYFFSIGAHHELIKGLAYSFKNIPLGSLLLLKDFTPIITQFGLLFATTLLLASPILGGLFLVDLVSLILMRTMPQFSSYFLVVPIKFLLGLFLMTMILTHINPFLEHLFISCFQPWQELQS